jgi:hypothetical protein
VKSRGGLGKTLGMLENHILLSKCLEISRFEVILSYLLGLKVRSFGAASSTFRIVFAIGCPPTFK